jgi:trehalose 2-sulfotransferase
MSARRSLLCGLLQSTGVAGRPESYFRQPDERSWAAQWGIVGRADGRYSYGDYLAAALNCGRTDNGLFGARIMWGTMSYLAENLAQLYPDVGGAEPGFDRDQIDDLIQTIAEHNAAWQEWFASAGVRPLSLAYEELDGDAVGTTQAVLDFLGLEPPPCREIVPQHRRLADSLNEQWADRYRRGQPS